MFVASLSRVSVFALGLALLASPVSAQLAHCPELDVPELERLLHLETGDLERLSIACEGLEVTLRVDGESQVVDLSSVAPDARERVLALMIGEQLSGQAPEGEVEATAGGDSRFHGNDKRGRDRGRGDVGGRDGGLRDVGSREGARRGSSEGNRRDGGGGGRLGEGADRDPREGGDLTTATTAALRLRVGLSVGGRLVGSPPRVAFDYGLHGQLRWGLLGIALGMRGGHALADQVWLHGLLFRLSVRALPGKGAVGAVLGAGLEMGWVKLQGVPDAPSSGSSLSGVSMSPVLELGLDIRFGAWTLTPLLSAGWATSGIAGLRNSSARVYETTGPWAALTIQLSRVL